MRSFGELVSELKVLTYSFSVKDGSPKVDFYGASDTENRTPNCSKKSGESSGVILPPHKLKEDRNGNYQEVTYNMKTIPKKYGDYLELDFSFLAKQDDVTI